MRFGSPSTTCTGTHCEGSPCGRLASRCVRAACALRAASACPSLRWATRASGSRSAWRVR
eukprot:6299281-Alexandrium_andersonii.AAC.1